MRVKFTATTGSVLLLACLAAVHAWTSRATFWPSAAPTPLVNLLALLRCEEQVTNIHDVHWAAACMANTDDSADCTLPDELAAPLNAARAAAEQRCMVDAGHEPAAASLSPRP